MHMKSVSVDHPAESVEYNAILGELIGSSVEALCERVCTTSAFTLGGTSCYYSWRLQLLLLLLQDMGE